MTPPHPTQMNLPYHKKSVSKQVDHLKPIFFFLKKSWKKNNYVPQRGEGVPHHGKFCENNELNF